MKESEKRNAMLKNKHKWINTGNGYSRCSECNIVRYKKYLNGTPEYFLNNSSVENPGCIKK